MSYYAHSRGLVNIGRNLYADLEYIMQYKCLPITVMRWYSCQQGCSYFHYEQVLHDHDRLYHAIIVHRYLKLR